MDDSTTAGATAWRQPWPCQHCSQLLQRAWHTRQLWPIHAAQAFTLALHRPSVAPSPPGSCPPPPVLRWCQRASPRPRAWLPSPPAQHPWGAAPPRWGSPRPGRPCGSRGGGLAAVSSQVAEGMGAWQCTRSVERPMSAVMMCAQKLASVCTRCTAAHAVTLVCTSATPCKHGHPTLPLLQAQYSWAEACCRRSLPIPDLRPPPPPPPLLSPALATTAPLTCCP